MEHRIEVSSGTPHEVTCICGFAFRGGFARMADAITAGELHLRAIQSIEFQDGNLRWEIPADPTLTFAGRPTH